MSPSNILFNDANNVITPNEISEKIFRFGYSDAVHKIIQYSKELDRDGEIFIKCTALIFDVGCQ